MAVFDLKWPYTVENGLLRSKKNVFHRKFIKNQSKFLFLLKNVYFGSECPIKHTKIFNEKMAFPIKMARNWQKSKFLNKI